MNYSGGGVDPAGSEARSVSGWDGLTKRDGRERPSSGLELQERIKSKQDDSTSSVTFKDMYAAGDGGGERGREGTNGSNSSGRYNNDEE